MNKLLWLGALFVTGCVGVRAQSVEMIKPSDAAKLSTKFDAPNVIVRPKKMEGAPILLWMAGTNGEPSFSLNLLKVMAEQGYRAVGVEYNDEPAVNQVCPRSQDLKCAEKFRAMRIYGTGEAEVSNSKNESIVARFVALLKELDRRHPKEGWGEYLTAEGEPEWSKIAVSGQSQGAGMAAFIAKQHAVARVVLFSSPIDSTRGIANVQLAPWLTWKSATPPEHWYAERNSREPFNAGLIKSYPALGIPADHVRVFSLDLPRNANASNPMVYHGINIRDVRYLPEWKFLFGDVRK